MRLTKEEKNQRARERYAKLTEEEREARRIKCRKRKSDPAKAAEYYKQNKENCKATQRKHYQKNKEQIYQKYVEWKEQNPERAKENCKRWYTENKEYITAKNRERQRNNVEKTRKAQRDYAIRNGIPKDQLERHSVENFKWRHKVYQRDNYTCQECDLIGYKMYAHHIKTWKEHPELRFDITNGITLCLWCHNHIHNRISSSPHPKNYEYKQSQ